MLVALAHSTVPLTHQMYLSEWSQVTLLQGSLIPAGWISRKHLPSGRGRSFFLTSLLIELIEVQKRTRCLQSAGTRGGLIHSLIRNPEADRTRYVGFRLASSKATSKLCMIPHGE